MDGSDDSGGVGYKRPPRHTRFSKGRSGNPRGRPKGSGVRSAVEKVLGRTVSAMVDGQRRRVPLTEALVLQLAQRALAGDALASRDILKIADQFAQARANEDPKDSGVTVILRRFVDPKDCNPALEALGCISEVERGYKIHPWVVEAAMARGIKLKSSDQALVVNSTIRPDDDLTPRSFD